MSHIKAILYHRAITLKRSKKAMAFSLFMITSYTLLAVGINYLMKSAFNEDPRVINFTEIDMESSLVVASPNVTNEYADYQKIFRNMASEDKKKDISLRTFENRSDINDWALDSEANHEYMFYVLMGMSHNTKTNVTMIYNHSFASQLQASVMATRVYWKKAFGEDHDFKFSITKLVGKMMDMIFGQISPTFAIIGITSIIPFFAFTLIKEIKGEFRDYVRSCSLKLSSFWIATFIVDFAIYFVVVTIVWIIFIAAQIKGFVQNWLSSWFALIFGGPSLILLSYCLAFMFSNQMIGAAAILAILIILTMIPMIVDIARQKTSPVALEWVYALLPQLGMQRILTYILPYVDGFKHGLGYYFTYKYTMPGLVMEFVDIIFYIIVLAIIEYAREKLNTKVAKVSFSSYKTLFSSIKRKNDITEEAKQMEQEVDNEQERYAIRIKHVSRLFFNSKKEPIAAVNDVSLGVKEGSLFGFLGANGAGKTTLIKMIINLLPTSEGTISINGVDISNFKSGNILSYCPQFNDHLCDEMTPEEHLKFYSILYDMSIEDYQIKSTNIFNVLEMDDVKNRPVVELSGGNKRKVAIAVAFFNPSNIILLDEPTSSLDPVTRKHVHELIQQYKGQKTFMLCTHLLNEAESLCDTISIMTKGCVYAIGSPQFLSQKFGTEYRIDIQLKEENELESNKCADFLKAELPQAVLSIRRPRARLYTIPSSSIRLPELFSKMEAGKTGDNGFSYYTCSSSSLEKVFLEIVRISESENQEFVL